jgi:membrane fusion protein (multidrug efflux system)
VQAPSEADRAAARGTVEQTQAALDHLLAARPYEVTAAQRAVEQARAQLALRQAGPAEADVAAAQARVAQAETALAQAQRGLGQVQLAAPFAGTVTQVSYRAGELAVAGTPGITLGDLSRLQVETQDLDEVGAATVEVGQTVQVRLNAVERVLPGRVIALSPQGTATQAGDANFAATIAFERPDPVLRWGQTVKVEFGKG